MMEISVIIPVYNAAEFLGKAVQSALQFDEVKEIVLAEDASTDHSLEICRQLVSLDSRVKLYQHSDKGNHGAGATRNLGIEKATSAYIAFLDSDDYYLPNRFETEKEAFKNPATDGVFGALGVEYLSEKGKEEYNAKFNSSALTTVQYAAEGKEVFRGLLGLTPRTFGTFFHLNTLTVRKSAVDKYHLRFNPDLRVHQDSDFIIRLAYHCHLKSGMIDKAIAVRGVHDNNRITKIVRYSRKYNERQYRLWNSLYLWSETVKVEHDVKKHLYLQNKAFELAVQSGIAKAVHLARTFLSHPDILKTRYRFTFSNSPQS